MVVHITNPQPSDIHDEVSTPQFHLVMLSFLRRLRNPGAVLLPLPPPPPPARKNSIHKPLVWIDCEMTGLNVEKDHIIEICCIITDGHLNVVDDVGYESTVFYPKKTLDNMNPWCVDQHGKSGLTLKVLENPHQTLAVVQKELLEYIQRYVPEPRTSLLAGNSVHMDKFFMMKEFPHVIDHLHYRLVDVSSIMEVGFRHNPQLMLQFPKKRGSHTAKSDILESINQLRWYRQYYLRGPTDEATEEPPRKKSKQDFLEDLLKDPLKPAKSKELNEVPEPAEANEVINVEKNKETNKETTKEETVAK